MTDQDRAAEARHGGRYITGVLAKMARLHPEAFANLQSGTYPNAWPYHLSPAGSTGTGRDTTEAYARGLAKGRDLSRPSLTEAAFDWPIYQSAPYRGYVTGPDPALPCTCGHLFTSHQTGEGPWTGFCGGTLGDLGEVLEAGADPSEPCACERPEEES